MTVGWTSSTNGSAATDRDGERARPPPPRRRATQVDRARRARPGGPPGIGSDNAQSTLHTPGPWRIPLQAPGGTASGSRSPRSPAVPRGAVSNSTARTGGQLRERRDAPPPSTTSPPSRAAPPRGHPRAGRCRRGPPASPRGGRSAPAPTRMPPCRAVAAAPCHAPRVPPATPGRVPRGRRRRASAEAEASAGRPNLAMATGCRGGRSDRSQDASQEPPGLGVRDQRAQQAAPCAPSRPSPSAVSARERCSSDGPIIGRGRGPRGHLGMRQLDAHRPRSRVAKNGDTSAVATTVAHGSWTKPGNVDASDRRPPPAVGAASRTRTRNPARASVMAAASPLGPEPTTIASRPASRISRAHHPGVLSVRRARASAIRRASRNAHAPAGRTVRGRRRAGCVPWDSYSSDPAHQVSARPLAWVAAAFVLGRALAARRETTTVTTRAQRELSRPRCGARRRTWASPAARTTRWRPPSRARTRCRPTGSSAARSARAPGGHRRRRSLGRRRGPGLAALALIHAQVSAP